MTNYNPAPPSGGDETETNVGALADGLAASAINSTEVDDGSTGYVGGLANGDNRNNTDNSVDVDAKIDVEANNGDNRDNEYDWSYDSKSYSDNDVITSTKTDTDIKTTTITDTDVKTDYDWSYDSKSYSDNDVITNTKTDTDIKTVTDTDIKTVSDNDTDIKTISDSYNTSDSFNKTDTDFAVLEDVKDFGNLGIAGHDLTFNLGDDFSFTLDVDNILNGALGGNGNVFNAIQANHLADQDSAWNIKMENEGANNNLHADAGKAYGSEGLDVSGHGWSGGAGDDVSGTSTADASAVLANSGFHLELVQGANLLSNTFDGSVVGGDVHSTGQDADSGA